MRTTCWFRAQDPPSWWSATRDRDQVPVLQADGGEFGPDRRPVAVVPDGAHQAAGGADRTTFAAHSRAAQGASSRGRYMTGTGARARAGSCRRSGSGPA
jgi:hypothetical protein